MEKSALRKITRNAAVGNMAGIGPPQTIIRLQHIKP